MIQLPENINTLGQTFSSVDLSAYDRFELNGDKDIFEKVIDDLMVEKYTDDPDMKDYIKSLPRDKKRSAILSLIGNDNVLWSKINDLLKERKTGYQRLKDVYFLLRDYVKIADVERKKFGEILTPFKELAEPMVRLVEKYDTEFWKNPNHKVLDSSAGYGTFLILSAYKFMVGLKDWEPDEEKRFKWVVENCLYYGELQAKSVFSWLVVIDPYDEYKTNTYYGSFLTEDFDRHAKEVWGVEKWDAIIQNPPYQTQKEGFSETQPLWHFFVQKSLGLLKDGSYMVMVHPSGWRNIDGAFSDLQKKMIKNQILELNINSESVGQKIFGATTGFDYYILRNVLKFKETNIVSIDGEFSFDLSKYGFIPSGNFEIFNLILAKGGDERVDIIHDYTYERRKAIMSESSSDVFKYPCIYTISKDEKIRLYYSSIKRGHFGVSKVIWSNGKASIPICDYDGKYGMTGFAYGISDKRENLDLIKIAMCSNKFISMMKSCEMNDGNRFNKRVMSLLRKDFWKYFIINDEFLYSDQNLNNKILELGCGLSSKMIKSYLYGDKCILDTKDELSRLKDRITKVLQGNCNSYVSDIDLNDKMVSGCDFNFDISKRFFKIDLRKISQIGFEISPKKKFDRIHIRLVLKYLCDDMTIAEFKEMFKKLFELLNEDGKIFIIDQIDKIFIYESLNIGDYLLVEELYKDYQKVKTI